MTEVFISYARSTARQAAAMAALLRALGFGVWRDDDLPPHRPFGDVIAERLDEARAVLVLWSADAARSHWVRAEAEMARMANKLVQLTLDESPLPMPFSQIQCANLADWDGAPDTPGLEKVLQSVATLVGRAGAGLEAACPPSAEPAAGRNGHGDASIQLRTTGAPSDLADTLRSDIAMALARQPGLHVSANAHAPADYRLEIETRASGARVRVTARLLACPSAEQMWSERFDGSDADLFTLQDQVSEAVAANVEALIRRARIAQAVARPAGDRADSNAATATIRAAAMAAINRMDAAGYADALVRLQPLIGADSCDADALAMAALAHACLWSNGYAEAEEKADATAQALARRALRQTDSQAFPTGLSAVALAMTGAPVESSLALTERIQMLTPGFAPALMWLGQVQLIAGQPDAAIRQLQSACKLDARMTVRPILLGYLGAARLCAETPEAALPALLEAVQLNDQIPMNNLFLAAALGLASRHAEGRTLLLRAAAVAPPSAFRLPLSPAVAARLHEGLRLLS